MTRKSFAPGKKKNVPGKRPYVGAAPGKIILTGEYAVVFGYPGIAIPAPIGMEVTFDEDPESKNLEIVWEGIKGDEHWMKYAHDAAEMCEGFSGTLTIKNQLPLGKGMGSSTALIIAISRCLLGDDCKDKAHEIESALNPGHSGIDFAVIWSNHPVRFEKDKGPETIDLPGNILDGTLLIDTGTPNETTPELVAWVREQLENPPPQGSRRSRSSAPAVEETLKNIGDCTRRLEAGEDLTTIIRDHHRAQVQLGVVLPEVQELIEQIEAAGGAAKVLGAGARTGGGGPACRSPRGGGGMVFAIGLKPENLQDLIPHSFTMHAL